MTKEKFVPLAQSIESPCLSLVNKGYRGNIVLYDAEGLEYIVKSADRLPKEKNKPWSNVRYKTRIKKLWDNYSKWLREATNGNCEIQQFRLYGGV